MLLFIICVLIAAVVLFFGYNAYFKNLFKKTKYSLICSKETHSLQKEKVDDVPLKTRVELAKMLSSADFRYSMSGDLNCFEISSDHMLSESNIVRKRSVRSHSMVSLCDRVIASGIENLSANDDYSGYYAYYDQGTLIISDNNKKNHHIKTLSIKKEI